VRNLPGAGIVQEDLLARRQTVGDRLPESAVAGSAGKKDQSPAREFDVGVVPGHFK
jgi:hypothetical protein